MKTQISSRDLAKLSEYLDGQLKPNENARLEARLRVEPELSAALESLQRTRLALWNLPRVRAPRNFTLKPEMVAARPRPVLFPVFGAASALATFALILVLFIDILGIGSPAAAPGVAERIVLSAESPAMQLDTAPRAEKSAEGVPAPTDTLLFSMTVTNTVPEVITATPGLMMMKPLATLTSTVSLPAPTSMLPTELPPALAGAASLADSETPTPSITETLMTITITSGRTFSPTEIYPSLLASSTITATVTVTPTSTPLATETPSATPTDTPLPPPAEPTALPMEKSVPSQVIPVPEAVTSQRTGLNRQPLHIAELTLAIVALITGLVALFLRRGTNR